MNAEELKGKLIRYDNTRYAMVLDTCRVSLPKEIVVITSTGRRVKKPTTHGLRVRLPSFDERGFNFKGDEVKIPITAIQSYRERKNGKDIPIDLE